MYMLILATHHQNTILPNSRSIVLTSKISNFLYNRKIPVLLINKHIQREFSQWTRLCPPTLESTHALHKCSIVTLRFNLKEKPRTLWSHILWTHAITISLGFWRLKITFFDDSGSRRVIVFHDDYQRLTF